MWQGEAQRPEVDQARSLAAEWACAAADGDRMSCGRARHRDQRLTKQGVWLLNGLVLWQTAIRCHVAGHQQAMDMCHEVLDFMQAMGAPLSTASLIRAKRCHQHLWVR